LAAEKVQKKASALVGCEPVSKTYTDAANTLDPANTSGKFGADSPESADSYRTRLTVGQLKVDRCRC
jgi:hypothetical protein